MKSLLHTLIAFLIALPIQATENAIDAAQDIARKYCQNPSLKKVGKSTTLRSASEQNPSYFIFTDDDTDKFCIVDADGEKILGYGDNLSDQLPSQLQDALDMYSSSSTRRSELRNSTKREDIPAFMDVVYGTRFPYNKYIPLRNGSDAPVGCVPTTLAQICKYYEYPSQLLNDIPPYAHISATNPDTVYQIEGQKAEGRTYDWSLILNHYKKDTTDDLNNEVAKLAWDCARSVETSFEPGGSSALTEMLHYSLSHYFGYNSDSLKVLSRNQYYREEWLNIIHEELSKKHPVFMSGTSYHNGGHAFLCDGYVDGFLHINWGWNGSSNGYFDVDILDYSHNRDKEQTSPDNGYSLFSKIIIGIVPGLGKTECKKPESAREIVKPKQEDITVDSRFRATDKGFVIYSSIDIFKKKMDEDTYFALGYENKTGKILFVDNRRSNYFTENMMDFTIAKEFDSTYLGKDLKLYILESERDRIENLEQDTIYEWWHPSSLFEPITISVPASIETNNQIVEPISVDLLGEYADSTIVLNIGFQTERPEGSMRYYALALIMGEDTIMSETRSDYTEADKKYTYIKKTFDNLDPANIDLDKEMTLLVMQNDVVQKNSTLNSRDWNVCENFNPVSFKLSDCKIFSKEFVVDTILHSTKGVTQRFEISFSNPTPFEFNNDIYFLVDNEGSGAMLNIPPGGTTNKIIERKIPLFTNNINGKLSIKNNFMTATELVFAKDTFSHVFYGFKGGDESTVSIQILNATNNEYSNSFVLLNQTDTFHSKTVTVEPLDSAQVKFTFPTIASDTSILRVNYVSYFLYDKDDRMLGEVTPLMLYGRVLQTPNEDDILISIDLKPAQDTLVPPMIVGFTSTLEDTSAYQRFVHISDSTAKAINLDFMLSDSCSIKNPKYIGLCREDGTFYAYMKLMWKNQNASENIPSNNINIIAVDGGIWISSDVDIPSLAIYNVDGKIVKTVGLKPASTIFVPLRDGVYIVEGEKFIIRNS